MRRILGTLFLTACLLVTGCGSSNDFGQPTGQQGNVPTNGGGNNTPQPTGTITGQVLDATTGQPLPGVSVTIPNANIAAQGAAGATTDANGNYTIFNAPVGTYNIRFQLDQFIVFERQVTVRQNETSAVATVVLSPGLTPDERFRFVLTWGAEPPDYDSHLWLPAANQGHVYYVNQGDSENFPFATLDVDDTSSFGPETITINQVLSGGVYEYGVHNFSETGTVAGAVVQIYDQSGLIATVTPTDTNGEYWVVATIDGATRELTIVDETLPDIRSPYTINQGATPFVLPAK